jgi:serine/threonine protein kinase
MDPMEPTLDNATMFWDALAEYVQTFLEAWEADHQPPPLSQHLPDGPPVLRQMTLIELIKVDLEFRWKKDFPKQIEDYVAEFPELAGECGPPADLIYEEYHVRRLEGETIAATDYFRRFPNQESRLRRLMGLGDPMASTALFPRGCARELQAGESIDDFLILATLGKGSFASVYLAQQKSMQRRVALKVSAVKGQEARTLAQLDHNNIVRVYDQRILSGEHRCLLYMQYVAGGTLADVIDRVRHLPLAERTGSLLLRAVEDILRQRGESPTAGSYIHNELDAASWPLVVCHLGMQLAYALNYAQAQGVLHRDIKPANVLMSADGAPMLADFNISFASQLEGATPTAFFGGSLAYMPPEQLEACNPAHSRTPEELDGRSDIYSLGVLLWELLYGKRPYPNEQMTADWSETLTQFARRRREEPPQPPEPLSRDPVHRALHAVLEKCLAANPDNRFFDGGELGRQLWLCTRPHTQMLLKSPHQGWRSFARRRPILTYILVILAPHLFAAVFNFVYNKTVIIDVVARTNPQAVETFHFVAAAVNSLCFPGGLAFLLWLVWPVYRALVRTKQAHAGLFRAVGHVRSLFLRRLPHVSLTSQAAPLADDVALARNRSMRLPYFAAVIGMGLWVLASIPYTLILPLSGTQKVHFALSLIVCGLIAGVYPFFGTAYVGVRVFYPALLSMSAGAHYSDKALKQLVWETGWMLLLTVAVPLVGGFMLYVGQKFGLQNLLVDISLGLLFVVGLIGIFIAFFMYQRIRDDVEALVEATQPSDTHAIRSTSVIGKSPV